MGLAKAKPKRAARRSTEAPPEPKNFTEEEKRELGKSIAGLTSKQLEKVIQLIQKHKPELVKDEATEIELDINRLTPQFLTDLQTYVDAVSKKKKRARTSDGSGPTPKKRKTSTAQE